jgi:hypothetical protein
MILLKIAADALSGNGTAGFEASLTIHEFIRVLLHRSLRCQGGAKNHNGGWHGYSKNRQAAVASLF